MGESIELALESRFEGLLFPSESDRPLHLVTWPAGQSFTVEALLAREGFAPDSPVEMRLSQVRATRQIGPASSMLTAI